MGTTDYSVWIEASPEDTWGIYVDPMRIPEWQTGSPVIEHVHGSGDQVGTTYVSRRRPGAARTTVTEVDKPRRLVTTTEAYLGLRFDVTSSLTPQSDGTLLELRAETHWPRGFGRDPQSAGGREGTRAAQATDREQLLNLPRRQAQDRCPVLVRATFQSADRLLGDQ